MQNYIKKVMDWMLDKEMEAADYCKIKKEDVDNQIKEVEEKIQELEQRYQQDKSQLEDVLSRLKVIRSHAESCKEQND